jgi:hypothetical protein
MGECHISRGQVSYIFSKIGATSKYGVIQLKDKVSRAIHQDVMGALIN